MCHPHLCHLGYCSSQWCQQRVSSSVVARAAKGRGSLPTGFPSGSVTEDARGDSQPSDSLRVWESVLQGHRLSCLLLFFPFHLISPCYRHFLSPSSFLRPASILSCSHSIDVKWQPRKSDTQALFCSLCYDNHQVLSVNAFKFLSINL